MSEQKRYTNFLLADYWKGSRRWIFWIGCLGLTILIGTLRVESGAEFSVSSLMILPVIALAWFGGRLNGMLMAFIAALVWIVAGFTAELEFSYAWIPWLNFLTRILTFGLVVHLVSQTRLHLKQESFAALHDPLTRLANRRGFIEAATKEVERLKRSGRSLAFVFLDLDNFKALNDTLGHEVGDNALLATAKVLEGELRSTDIIARMGGDEFSAVLPEINYDDAVEAGKTISEIVNLALVQFPPVAASLGIVWFENGNQSIATMIKAADVLMYEVKKNGKGTVKICRWNDVNTII